MSTEYQNNHYVPVWYQKQFIPLGQTKQELYYLDMKPGEFVIPGKGRQKRSGLRKWGPKRCFSELELYTRHFGAVESTAIEQQFFGPIDDNGKKGVEYFANFVWQSVDYDAFHSMIFYMSTQKLRTPKGLGWLSDQTGASGNDDILNQMIQFRDIFSAIWGECVWPIADAKQSDTKFIISDHPVTVYNRRCGPRSQWCRGFNDPDIRFHATHTISPLSLDKILILSNRSWVRNPYQRENGLRPNPNPVRSYLIDYTSIQTMRHLAEKEVREINFIIKTRAHRYIAAAKEEWLYPERHVSKSQWHEYGGGYLLMPDPRSIYPSGGIFLGFEDGTTSAYDEYGRQPLDPDYNKEGKDELESISLDRFKGEFARLNGPTRRGRAHSDKECDNREYHQHHLDLEPGSKRKMKTSR